MYLTSLRTPEQPTDTSSELCKVKDEFERVVDCMHLVEGEMTDPLAKRPCVLDRPDHFAHEARLLASLDLDLGW